MTVQIPFKRNDWIFHAVEELFSARVPKSSAEVRRVFIHDIKVKVSGSKISKVIIEMK